jgi:hypothetical protein
MSGFHISIIYAVHSCTDIHTHITHSYTHTLTNKHIHTHSLSLSLSAVADTGLDVEHCMMYDDLPFPNNSYNPLKRKLVYYSVPSSCAPAMNGSSPTVGVGDYRLAAACGDYGDAVNCTGRGVCMYAGNRRQG